MEYPVSVNSMLKEAITKIDHNLLPPGYSGDLRNKRLVQQQLSDIIDMIGGLSANAQKLGRVITTGDKLRSSPTHTLYLLKDPDANEGAGQVIGLLKIAQKDLYLFHPNGELLQSSPMCVLDFFVSSDYQRQGLGKKLFDHMLEDTKLQAFQVAIDYPSEKMEQFLERNYNLRCLLRQNNNFAVSHEFFGVQNAISSEGSNSTNSATPQAVGRFAARKPPSEIATIIHGTACEKSNPTSRPLTPTNVGAMTKEPVSNEGKLVVPEQANVHNTRPSTLEVQPGSSTSPRSISPAGTRTPRRDSQVTQRGYMDLQFYHNKLCDKEYYENAQPQQPPSAPPPAPLTNRAQQAATRSSRRDNAV